MQVTDGNNATTNQSFSIGISNTVQITTTSLAGGTNITFYSAVLSAGDGQPSYTWSLSPGSSRLPPNISLTTNGVILGTPEGYGTFNFSVRVKDNLAGQGGPAEDQRNDDRGQKSHRTASRGNGE